MMVPTLLELKVEPGMGGTVRLEMKMMGDRVHASTMGYEMGVDLHYEYLSKVSWFKLNGDGTLEYEVAGELPPQEEEMSE
jgi:hypothetical protein